MIFDLKRAARYVAGALLLVGAACGDGTPVARAPSAPFVPVSVGELRPPEAFVTIPSRADRSRALFNEASRVLLSPRCLNCHPAGDSPSQGDALQRHDPPVVRGPNDRGVPGLLCTSCHQDRNATIARVPGAPEWHLAPRAMAWVGRTPHALCEQLKDPARNGQRSLAQVVEHATHDAIVAWGWAPGADRTPAPGSQAQLGALVAAWVRDGAECPLEGAP